MRDIGSYCLHGSYDATIGLIVRYLQAIESKEGEAAGAQLQYTCRCSFLQIYNEQISDLLHPTEKPLALRYDSERGVYAENLTEHVVVNGVQHPSPVRRYPASSLVLF